MEIRNLIREKRIEKGLSTTELAKLVGVSQSTITRWESGNIATMKQSKIVALARALGISPVDILDEVPKEQYYLDDETAALAQSIKDDPDLRILMDASRKLSPEELKAVITMVKVMKGVE